MALVRPTAKEERRVPATSLVGGWGGGLLRIGESALFYCSQQPIVAQKEIKITGTTD